MHRRQLLQASAALAAAGLPWPALMLPTPARADAKPRPFDYAWLKGQARALANGIYHPPANTLPEALRDLTWDQYQSIQFRKDHQLWARDDLEFRAAFFHLGLFFKTPVRMYQVIDGQAHELAYDPAMFDLSKSGLSPRRLPRDLGFAGFRLLFHTDWNADVAAFLGASYFRAVGGDKQYGMSARGLAIDTGMDRAEEFPMFTAFWLERPAAGSGKLTVYALLDSPSVAGAYRFDIYPGGTLVMDVDAALYPRQPIERLGIAPLTSMYQCGENDRRMANDWRPEIHDSDGLSLWTGAGEWIWRPLVNPATMRVNSFLDQDPRGFGLLQRDRHFDHYQDDGVYYDKRPSVWVEPKPIAGKGWGKGAVMLVELPTADETFDNIVAFWNPAQPPQPGQELLFGYRLYWGAQPPAQPPLATVRATRDGIGGVVGQKRKYFSWRFAVDFAGGDLALPGKDAKVEPVISASRGRVEITSARPIAVPGLGHHWRAMFDLKLDDDSVQPVDLRLYLRLGTQALTETWIYQWTPPPPAERKF